MLTLLLGIDWVANRDTVLKMVAKDVASEKGNRIIMVPELISHDMERRLCDVAGDTASRYAEVLSFTRLARRVADNVGAAATDCLDNGGRIVAMAAASRQLRSKLKAYASVETKPEFLGGLIDAIDEFKRCCISSSDLKQASTITEGIFAQKLEELSLLLEAYDSICARGKRDPRDQMTWLLEHLTDGDFGQIHTFYIDGFPDFTRQHFVILEYLISVSPSVVVSLNCDVPGSNELAFEKAGFTAAQLIRSAKEAGVPVEVQYVQPYDTPTAPIASRLFQGNIGSYSEAHDVLRMAKGDSLYEECLGAACRIKELVNSGCRYRQISVVCTDMGKYQNMINLVFHRYGISFYQSGTESILEKSVISTVLSGMEAALGGFEIKDVLRYLKSPLSPIPLETVDLLENYAIMWNIDGSRWLNPWEYHPNGLGEEWSERAQKKLEQLNQAREAGIKPLVKLLSDFRSASKIKDQVHALCSFFENISLSKSLSRLSEQLELRGDYRSAQILDQLWEILLSALEQLHDMLGESYWDAPTFTRLFTLLLGQYDVGTIPPVLDAVTVGPVNAMRCQEADHLILLGAEEGMLPGYGGSQGVLTDQERVFLREIGIPLTGGSLDGLQAEFAEIYGVFCGARKSILVSCSSDQPSFVYKRLSVMTDKHIRFGSYVDAGDDLDAAALLVRFQKPGYAEELKIYDEYIHLKKQSKYALGSVSAEKVQELYGNQLQLSASQVDKQADCRFSYFMRYGMRAKERIQADVDPAEFGTYVHAVLEETAREVMALGGFHAVSLNQTMEIAMRHSESYASKRFAQLDSKRAVYLFHRNIQELSFVIEELWNELSVSDFSPIDFELAFGAGEAMDAIDIPGAKIPAQLRGFVDRVDAWNNGINNYFRVVDYKTGRKDFDYCDVFNGLGLQMLLYLFALEQEGESILGQAPLAVGVQYFPARSPVLSSDGKLTDDELLKERNKNWKRKGLILADSDVINAMQPEGAPSRLSCKFGKDGQILGDVFDRDQLRMLKKYVFRTLKAMVDEIASGEVTPNPYTRGTAHNPCTYCPYGQVCHSANVQGRRNYKTMSADKFWEEVGKEMSRNG